VHERLREPLAKNESKERTPLATHSRPSEKVGAPGDQRRRAPETSTSSSTCRGTSWSPQLCRTSSPSFPCSRFGVRCRSKVSSECRVFALKLEYVHREFVSWNLHKLECVWVDSKQVMWPTRALTFVAALFYAETMLWRKFRRVRSSLEFRLRFYLGYRRPRLSSGSFWELRVPVDLQRNFDVVSFVLQQSSELSGWGGIR